MSEQITKRCSRGEQCVHPDGCILPATAEHFYRNSSESSGLQSECKYCSKRRMKLYREQNKLQIAASKRHYRAAHIEEIRQYERTYREQHTEERRELGRRWMINNRERTRTHARNSYRRRRDHVKQYVRNWKQTNRDKERTYIARRKARVLNLPDTLIANDWRRALDHFDGCCAACGRPAGLWHTLAMDHWIPLSSPDCPGTVPENIVPLCHGVDGCNNIKNSRDARTWLVQAFGQRKASEIFSRIEAYFEWVRSQH